MRIRTALPVLVGLFAFLGVVLLFLGRPARVSGQQAGKEHSAHANMTEAAMKRWNDAWWAAHPRVGERSRQAADGAFIVTNFRFDADGNAATQVDTVHILAGESVSWTWVTGIHSITNGTGSLDPNAGTLFDQPSNINNQDFSFTFNSVGTFPFFCRPHEPDMMGFVNVTSATGVEPTPGVALGFTDGPWPNPTRTGARFAFALREPGRARAEVFDTRGRRVAIVLDRDLGAGPHAEAWDGRATGGDARAGLYWLRLRLPGYEQSRPIVIAR